MRASILKLLVPFLHLWYGAAWIRISGLLLRKWMHYQLSYRGGERLEDRVTRFHHFYPVTPGNSPLMAFTLSQWVSQLSSLSLHHTETLSHHNFYQITLDHSALMTLGRSALKALSYLTLTRLGHSALKTFIASHCVTQPSRRTPYHTVSLSPDDFHSFTLVHAEQESGQNQESTQSHGKVTKTQLNITNESQEVSPVPAGDHKALMNRRKSMTKTHTNDPQKNYRLGREVKIFYWRA